MVPISLGGFGVVLRNPSFRALWVCQALSQVADKIFFIVLVSMVAGITPSNTAMSFALVAYTLPTVLFGAIAGTLVDRWDKRRTMIVTNLLRAVSILLTAWTMHNYAVLVVVAFAVSSFSQPFGPAESSLIPLLVRREALLAANSLFATTIMASIIVGFTLGEPLIALTTLRYAPLAIALMYLVSAASLLRVTPPPSPTRTRRSFRWIFVELRLGLRYILRDPPVKRGIFELVALYAMFSGISVVSILFARQILQASFSLFLALAGVGMAIGAWLMGHFGAHWDRARTIRTGFVLLGIALMLMVPLRSGLAWLAYSLSLFLGISSALVAIPIQTSLQEHVPEDRRGRVFGAQNMAINIASSIPMAGIGPLADLIGIKPVFAAMSLAMFLVAALSSRHTKQP